MITNYQLPRTQMFRYKVGDGPVMFGRDLNNGSRKEGNVLFL